MRICELNAIDQITTIHEAIFGTAFPHESYIKKCKSYPVLIYGYFANEKIVGYSMVVVQEEERNLYAWYGGLIPEFQGHGVTIEFFNILVEKARELGYSSISLATTNCRPNMLRLAIKYGFDICDVKKRDYGEGNKIYFKYTICAPSVLTVKLTNEDGSKLKAPELEKILVSAYKTNCIKIIFEGTKCESDRNMILYARRYCKKFLREIEIECENSGCNL